MNLHFIPDNGFLNYFIHEAEKLDDSINKFIIVTGATPISKPTKKKIVSKNVIACRYQSAEYNNYVGNEKEYKKVFFHFLTDTTCDFINRNSDSSIEFYWMFWGADLYMPLSKFANSIYDLSALQYYHHHTTFNKTGSLFLDFIKYSKRKIAGNYFDNKSYRLRVKSIERINYFCHYNMMDYNLLKQTFQTKAVFKPFFYHEYDYSQLLNLDYLDTTSIKHKFNITAKTIIQVGHSASLSNNHFSAFQNLSKQSLVDTQIICPLSYGDFKYREKVIEEGKKLFGNDFIPILDYLSKDEYLSLLSTIDISIMNHYRTEAAGNVFMLMAMQKKVVLNQKSNLYRFLKEKGSNIYNNEEDYIKVSNESYLNNYKIIIDEFSDQKLIRFVIENLN
jgi:dTDP-N-acetylfucosamine:lipid II N-acetylfucosaminyltransferase